MSLDKHLPFVKEQIEIQEKLAKKFESQPWRHNLHSVSADKFRAIANDISQNSTYIQELENRPDIKSSSAKPQLSLSFEEIKDLPPELLSELSISEADKAEFTIQEIINDLGGVASLDRILVGLYRKTGEIYKRTNLTSRLYRMGQKDLVFSVPSKKGVYSTRKLNEEEAGKVLNFDNEVSDLEQE